MLTNGHASDGSAGAWRRAPLSSPPIKIIVFLLCMVYDVLMEITPISLDEANAFIEKHHRHHKRMPGCKFCIGLSHNDVVRGVVIVGRPVARFLDDGWTLEVNRCCTDGIKNGCSMLYGASWRAAKALGYKRLITYTLPDEGGASLRASNWKMIGLRGGGNWNTKTRPRIDTKLELQGQKLLWEAV